MDTEFINGSFDIQKLAEELEVAVASSVLSIARNQSPSSQHSLVLNPEHAIRAAQWLRDQSPERWDFLSNVTAVDWPAEAVAQRQKALAKLSQENVDASPEGGYLEAVYHLYSLTRGLGPLILRLQTQDRNEQTTLPSLTPVWRSAEFQEREAFDLYGIRFAGHPDLRRIMMWDGFEGHPMRKDYVEPDDYEYEPTPHDEVLKRSQDRLNQGDQPKVTS
jgi:NADH-quinone oxidoreductase subunit C